MDLIEDFPNDCILIRDILQEHLEVNQWPPIRGRLLLEDYILTVLDEKGILYDHVTNKQKIHQQRIRLCITRAMKHLGYRLASNSTNAYINTRVIEQHGDVKEEQIEEGAGEESR